MLVYLDFFLYLCGAKVIEVCAEIVQLNESLQRRGTIRTPP